MRKTLHFSASNDLESRPATLPIRQTLSTRQRPGAERYQGKLYLADAGKKVSIIRLQNESICVNGNDVLASVPSLKHTISMMRKVAALLSGGLFYIRLEGSGFIVIQPYEEVVAAPQS